MNVILVQAVDKKDIVRPAVLRAMSDCGLNPTRLARRAGVSEGKLRSFLDGRSDIMTVTLSKIMHALGLALR